MTEAMVSVLVFSSWNNFLFWVDTFFLLFYFGLSRNNTGKPYYFLLSSNWTNLSIRHVKIISVVPRNHKIEPNWLHNFSFLCISFQNKIWKKIIPLLCKFTELFQTKTPHLSARVPHLSSGQSALPIFTPTIIFCGTENKMRQKRSKLSKTVFSEVPKM